MTTLKDKACIVGVGESAYTRGSEQTVLRLVLEASRYAIADAGLDVQDIDRTAVVGIIVKYVDNNPNRIVFVDDGSSDGSWSAIERLASDDPLQLRLQTALRQARPV